MRPKICRHLDMLLPRCRWRMPAACSAITITLQLPPPFRLCGRHELCRRCCRRPSIVKPFNTVGEIIIWYPTQVFPFTKSEEVSRNHQEWVLNTEAQTKNPPPSCSVQNFQFHRYAFCSSISWPYTLSSIVKCVYICIFINSNVYIEIFNLFFFLVVSF